MKINLTTPILLLLVILFNCSDDDPGIVELDKPSNIIPFDIDNNNNASDIRVFFNTPENAEFISEFRVILVNSLASSSFDISQAESLNQSAYHKVISSPGQFRFNLTDQLTDSDNNPITNGNTYVVFVLAIASSGNIENVISAPSGELELTDLPLYDLYTSSRDNGSVELFDGVTGEHIKQFVKGGSGGLSRTQEVLFGNDGALYVSGRDNSSILKYNGETGAFMGSFTTGYALDEPTKMNYGPDGYLYVSQWGQTKDAIVRFDTATGAFVDEIVLSYFQGMDHAWDSDNNLYITSWGIADVRKYDMDGNYEGILISNNLVGPVNLWINGDDLYVVDWTDGNVKIFDKNNGSFKSTFLSGFNRVEGHVFDHNGNLLLCDWADNQVKKFNATTGSLISIFIDVDKLGTPNSITLGPNHRPN